MADIVTKVSDGLCARLQTIAGLRANAGRPDALHVPAAWPRLIRIDYDRDMGGRMVMTFEVMLLSRPFEQGVVMAQRETWPYLSPTGPQSLKAALEADPTLGGIAEQVVVTAARDLGTYEFDGVDYVGAVFDVEVWV